MWSIVDGAGARATLRIATGALRRTGGGTGGYENLLEALANPTTRNE
jgi:hypothetical protein